MSSTITGAPTEYYNQKNETRKAERKWWNEEDNHYIHTWQIFDRMKKHQSFRSVNNVRFARLYSDLEILGLKAGQYSRVTNPSTFIKSRVTYNVIKSCIDSATAKIGAMKPRPVYMAENGTFSMQLRAKRMSQFILGMFEQIGQGEGDDKSMYGIGRQIFRDACTFGTGVVHFYADEEKGQIFAERNICEDIVVDETEGMYRKPRQMHRYRYMSREVLLDRFPEHAEKIKSVPGVDEKGSSFETVADMVETLESWHLPSGPNAKDGKRVFAIQNCDLYVEEYHNDYFPFLTYRWNNRILGWYGQGLAEELMGIQLEINKLLRNIQISQHLMAVPQVWLEYQSKTATKKISNKIGGINYYLGKPPIPLVPQAMSAEVYQHLERLYQRAYEITGISMLTATSQKPPGLDSAVALREYKDSETQRFAAQQASYEDFFVQAAEMIRKECKRLQKEKGIDPVVLFRDGTSTKELRFSDVDLPDSKLVVAPRAANLLPKEPAGRFATVKEMIEAGIYSKEEAIDLLDFPDMSKINNVKLSQRHVVIKMVEEMVEENIYMSPEPYLNLDFCLEYAQAIYSRGKIDKMPEERLEKLRRFMADCDRMIDMRNQEAAAMQAQAQQEVQQPMIEPAPVAAPGLEAEGVPAIQEQLQPMA